MTVKQICEEEFVSSGSLLQTRFWARLKKRFGWSPTYLARNSGECLLVLSRRVAPGIELAYMPDAPPRPDAPTELRDQAGEGLRTLCAEMSQFLGSRTMALRCDLPWRRGSLLPHGGLRKAPLDVQPADTVLVDLGADEEALLAAMKSRSRRNIRKSVKSEVTVRKGTTTDLAVWYDLYRITAQRDRIAIHAPQYYRTVIESASDDPDVDVELLVAEYKGAALAGIMVAYTAEVAVYLYGASSNEERDRMPAYALQWEAIRRAKSRGCRVYDMFGIPPSDDPNHPMHGLYQFKVGFGGRVHHRTGCWDYPVRPITYSLYREAERVRQFYYKKLRKRS